MTKRLNVDRHTGPWTVTLAFVAGLVYTCYIFPPLTILVGALFMLFGFPYVFTWAWNNYLADENAEYGDDE